MKRSRQDLKVSSPKTEEVMQFIDDEISKIVADIDANRPPPPKKSRSPRSKAPRHPQAA